MSTELAWAAGFVDGEGCFSVTRQGKRKTPAVQFTITQVDREPLDRLRDATELLGTVLGPCSPPSHKGKPYYRYCMVGLRVHLLFDKLEPYLCSAKKAQYARVVDQVNLG